jgi:DNA-directed RNA polymerase specialized sigma24 family protein
MDRLLSNDVIARVVSVLTPEQRDIYLLVEGLQYKVTEVANMFGYRREWAQRELGKARQAIADLAQAWN